MADFRKPILLNRDDYNEQFYKQNYLITVTSQGIQFIVNADCAGNAMDEVIDYCEEHYPGLIMPREDEDSCSLDFICGGNHERYLNTMNVDIQKLLNVDVQKLIFEGEL